MRAATAAILPSAIATSRTAERLFFGSITWPPRSSTSYFCCAWAWVAAAASSSVATASRLTTRPPLGGEARAQVLAEVERALDLVALHLAREGVVERVAALLALRAAQPDRRAVDRAGEVARREVALVRAQDLVAVLPQLQQMARGPGGVLDPNLPGPRQVGRGRSQRLLGLGLGALQHRDQPVADQLLVAGVEHVRVHGHAGQRGVVVAARREHRDARVPLEQ